MAYSHGTIPDMTYMTAMLLQVRTIIVAVVAVEMLGCTPFNINIGPKNIPAPIPIRPATNPAAKAEKEKYRSLG